MVHRMVLRRGVLTDGLGADDFSGHGLVKAHKAVLAAAGLDTPGEGPGFPAPRDEGHVSIRLIDAATDIVVAHTESDRERNYAFTFDVVAACTYRLEAGTDRDGDRRSWRGIRCRRVRSHGKRRHPGDDPGL